MPRHLALVSLLLLGPACSPVDPEAERQESAIMFGQADPGHTAVGLLTLGATVCGGTLVASDLVLTAARCVGAGSGTFVVGGYSYPVVKAALHPGYVTGSVNYDFALATLGQPVADVIPATPAQTAPKKGEAITIVGFGETGSGLGDGGYRRVTTNVVSDLQALTFSFAGAKAGGGNICTGDAGGASFRIEGGQEQLVGVHSAPSEPCGVAGLDGRVDAVQGWLALALKPAPGPAPADQQPPSVLISEPGAGAILGPSFTVWVTAIDGEGGLASISLVVDGQVRGTKAASPATFDLAGLAAGEHTLRADAVDGAGNVGSSEVKVIVEAEPAPGPNPGPAPAPAPTPGGFGTSCSSAKECASGLCASDSATGQSYCTQLCNQLHPCPDGGACLASGKMYICALGGPTPPKTNPGNGGRPVDAGPGCSLSGAPRGPAPLMTPLLLALALALGRRRR